MAKNILIIGAGRIGRALGRVLSKAGHHLFYWDKNPELILEQKNLNELVPQAEVVILTIPSWAIRQVLNDIISLFRKETLVITPAKGIEVNSLKTMYDVLDELLTPHYRFALLYGPLMAEEILSGKSGVGLVIAGKVEIYQQVFSLFEHSLIRLEYSSDVIGGAWVGPLKNVYALGLGIADALVLGNNIKGWLLVQAIQEMAEIVHRLGGREETVYGSGGIGDLVLTAFSPYSRNRLTGEKLIKTGKAGLISEGIVSVKAIGKLLKENFNSLPFLDILYQVIVNNQDPRTVFTNLFTSKFFYGKS